MNDLMHRPRAAGKRGNRMLGSSVAVSDSDRLPLIEHPADFRLLDADGGLKAELTGDWTSRTMGGAADRLRAEFTSRPPQLVDMTQMGRCDTSGAYAIVRAAAMEGGKARIKAPLKIVYHHTILTEKPQVNELIADLTLVRSGPRDPWQIADAKFTPAPPK